MVFNLVPYIEGRAEAEGVWTYTPEMRGTGGDCTLRSFMMCAPHQISGDQFKKNGMGEACSTYGGRERMHTDLCFGNLREGDNFEDQGMYGTIILKLILRK